MQSDVFFDNPWSDMQFHRKIEARYLLVLDAR